MPSRIHLLGILLVVLNAVFAAIATDPEKYGITIPYVSAWLALIVLANGMIIKEMPSSTQETKIKVMEAQIPTSASPDYDEL